MKDGLIWENGELRYYVNDYPEHAGVVKVDGAIYYISSEGRAVKGQHIVHGEMANGLLKRGTYTFGDDYKLVKGSYIAPREAKKKKDDKKKKIVIITFSILLAILLIVVGVDLIYPILNPEGTGEFTHPTGTVVEEISLPTFETDVLLCSTKAKNVYDGEMTLSVAVKTGDPYRPFVFAYDLGSSIGTLMLSEKADLSGATEYI